MYSPEEIASSAPIVGAWKWWAIVPIAAVIAASAGLTYMNLRGIADTEQAVVAALERSALIDQFAAAMQEAEAGERGYAHTGLHEHQGRYYAAMSRLPGLRAELARLLQQDPALAPGLRELEVATDDQLARMERVMQAHGPGAGAPQAMRSARSDGEASDRQRVATAALSSRIDQAVRRSVEAHGREVESSYRVFALSLALNVGLLCALVLWMRALSRRSLRARRLMQEHNERLSRVLAVSEARNSRMHAISELGRFLQGCTRSDEAVALLREHLPGQLTAAGGALYLRQHGSDRLALAFRWGDRDHVDTMGTDECWALRRGQVVEQPRGAGATACAHLRARSVGDGGEIHVHGAVSRCLPLSAHSEFVGLLILDRDAQSMAARTDLGGEESLDDILLEQAALALASISLRESLRQASIRDALTGLYNRRFLEEAAAREVALARREQTTNPGRRLLALMIDIDHFKRFNDQHGHDVGDRVLREVATVLRNHTRASDVVARYGGEEFTVLLSGITFDDGQRRAEALRAAVAAIPVSAQVPMPITVSIGMAFFPNHGDSIEAVLRAADSALYHAKRRGRNQVAQAGDDGAAREPTVQLTAECTS